MNIVDVTALARHMAAGLAMFLPVVVWADVSLGTGFFVTGNGYLVTNYHVVENAKKIAIRSSRGEVLEASIAAHDQSNDLVLLKVSGVFEPLPIANSRMARPGTRVVTMGFPHVGIQGGEPKITDGMVSSTTGIGNDPRVFQISVPIQAGNSGGPLVSVDGNVVGVVTAKLSALAVLKQTGDLPQNVNYAIKSNYLLELIGVVDGLERQLVKPRSKPLPSTEALADTVARSIALVVAESGSESPAPASATSPAKQESSVGQALPRYWRSIQTGNTFAVRRSGESIFWEGTNPSGSCSALVRGEAQRKADKTYSGVGYITISCGNQRCDFTGQYSFNVVANDKILVDNYAPRRIADAQGRCNPSDYATQSTEWVPRLQ